MHVETYYFYAFIATQVTIYQLFYTFSGYSTIITVSMSELENPIPGQSPICVESEQIRSVHSIYTQHNTEHTS